MTDLPADGDRLARAATDEAPDTRVRERVATLLALLGRPDRGAPVVHVAGSHGRGSVAAGITALVAGLGLQPGAVSTAHLQDVRERVRVAGVPLSAEALSTRLDELEPYLSEVGARLGGTVGLDETLAGLALSHFADVPVDVVVLEATRSPRTDPFAEVPGRVGVLTGPISDTRLWGPTPEEARALAARVEDGGTIVVAGVAPEVETALRDEARTRDQEVVAVDADTVDARLAVGGHAVTLRGARVAVEDVFVPLHGAHQVVNALCAFAAVEALVALDDCDPDVVRAAVAAWRAPGRLEVVRRRDAPPVILDAADDPAAAAALTHALDTEFSARERHVVVACERDVTSRESLAGTVAGLVEGAGHVVVTVPDRADAHDLETVRAVVPVGSATVETAGSVAEAVDLATAIASADDVVVVVGSPGAVGDARTALGLPVDPLEPPTVARRDAPADPDDGDEYPFDGRDGPGSY